LNQKAEINPGTRQLRQELDQLHEQQRQEEQRKREAEERMKTYLLSLRSQEKARQQQDKTLTQPQKTAIQKTPTLSPQEKQAAKMVEKYYELERTYLQFKERGRSRSSEIIAEGDMNRFLEKIYNDKSVMSYVQNHDQKLFKKMSGMEERQRELVKAEREKGFELSL
jgi:hypothetical protein